MPRLVDLDTRLADVETMIQWLKKANLDLNARVSAAIRRKAAEDPPGPTNDPPPDTRQVPIFPREKSRRGF